MTIGFEDLLRHFDGLSQLELVRWVENRWVLPESEGGAWRFDEVDVARVGLILEIRREFSVDGEALGLVLGLLDQLYGVRRQMRRLCRAVAAQDPEVQAAITRALATRDR